MENTTIGKTTIAPSVLTTIAKLTTLAVPGVSRMATVNPGTNYQDGVKVKIDEGLITLDLQVIISSDNNARLIAEQIQERVRRQITEIVGMEVAKINIHIMDVDIEV